MEVQYFFLIKNFNFQKFLPKQQTMDLSFASVKGDVVLENMET